MVLAELDLKRQNQLLETIEDRFQTLITTTHLGSFDAQWLKESQILTVDRGSASRGFLMRVAISIFPMCHRAELGPDPPQLQ